MCQACHADVATARKRRLLAKRDFSPEERRAYERLLRDYREELEPIEGAIREFVRETDESDLSNLATIRRELERLIGERDPEFEAVFREGGRLGLEAGRATAARQFDLAVDFEQVPQRAIDAIDDWVDTAAGSTLETITEDSARWIRGAHEDGVGVDEIGRRLNDELFAGRLEDHVAERAARTGTIATANTGQHSAIEDSTAIGEEWITSIDGRQRESHEEANGQIVPVDESFLVRDGVYMEHPGDPTAPVGEVVNCRCTIAPVFADQLTEEEVAALEAGERLNV